MHLKNKNLINISILFSLLVMPILAAESPVAPDAELELLSETFKFTEGPNADAQGNVYFTDQPNDRIMIWTVDGTLETFLQPSGRSNGLYFDVKGNLWACADEHRQLWRITPKKTVTVVLNGYGDDKYFNGPNDLWITARGGIYFTDPLYKRPYREPKPNEDLYQGVYYLAPGEKEPKRMVEGLKQCNGIIGTPDGKLLYVADIGDSKTYRFTIADDATLTEKKLFCEMGSDGMTVDEEGNVYLTNNGVFVFNPAGEQIAHIEVPEKWTANVCFGGVDRHWLYITAMDSLYRIRMRVKG